MRISIQGLIIFIKFISVCIENIYYLLERWVNYFNSKMKFFSWLFQILLIKPKIYWPLNYHNNKHTIFYQSFHINISNIFKSNIKSNNRLPVTNRNIFTENNWQNRAQTSAHIWQTTFVYFRKLNRPKTKNVRNAICKAGPTRT